MYVCVCFVYWDDDTKINYVTFMCASDFFCVCFRWESEMLENEIGWYLLMFILCQMWANHDGWCISWSSFQGRSFDLFRLPKCPSFDICTEAIMYVALES